MNQFSQYITHYRYYRAMSFFARDVRLLGRQELGWRQRQAALPGTAGNSMGRSVSGAYTEGNRRLCGVWNKWKHYSVPLSAGAVWH